MNSKFYKFPADVSASKIPFEAKFLLCMIIALNQNPHHDYFKTEDLSKKCGMNPRQTKRWIAWLKKHNLIVTKPVHKGKGKEIMGKHITTHWGSVTADTGGGVGSVTADTGGSVTADTGGSKNTLLYKVEEYRRENMNEKILTVFEKVVQEVHENGEHPEGFFVDQFRVTDALHKRGKFPFESPEFLEAWFKWIFYKKSKFRAEFSTTSQAESVILKLVNETGGNEIIATKAIVESLASGWKNIYITDNLKNDKQSKINKAEQFIKDWTNGK